MSAPQSPLRERLARFKRSTRMWFRVLSSSLAYQEDLGPETRLLSLALSGEQREGRNSSLAQLYRQIGAEACFQAAKRNQVQAAVGQALAEVLGENALPAEWSRWLEENV